MQYPILVVTAREESKQKKTNKQKKVKGTDSSPPFPKVFLVGAGSMSTSLIVVS